jgi:signal peptidase I
MKHEVVVFRGSSMDPCLKSGDRLYIDRVPMERLRIGNLVAVDAASKAWVVHRFIQWRIEGHRRIGRLKGDNLLAFDRFALSEKNYRGRIVARKRKGRRTTFNPWCGHVLARLSAANLTAGQLRTRLKHLLVQVASRIPGLGSMGRRILNHSMCYRFAAGASDERIVATCCGKLVGGMGFNDNSQAPATISVAFPFSLIISPEKLAAKLTEKIRPFSG